MGPKADQRDRLAELAAELRNATAAVTGYLELILEGDPETISESQLRWMGVIERRLEALENLSRELRKLCAELRDPGPPSQRDPTTTGEPAGK